MRGWVGRGRRRVWRDAKLGLCCRRFFWRRRERELRLFGHRRLTIRHGQRERIVRGRHRRGDGQLERYVVVGLWVPVG